MQEAVEVKSNGKTLRGMLHKPTCINGKLPLLIIFHGFKSNKMEKGFLFVELSRTLEKLGIASIRFDFAGSGESDGDFMNMTISTEVGDAVNILNFVKSLKFVDETKIGVLGMSLGGAVASILAGTRKADINTLCLWCPATGALDNMKKTCKLQNIDITDAKEKGFMDIRGLRLNYEFLRDALQQDIYGTASAYDKNTLLLHGDKDEEVPLRSSELYLEIYGDRAQLKVIKGANHTFQSIECRKQLLEYTVEFITKELK